MKNRIALFGRYDRWDARGNSYDRKMYIYGVAYHMNKYVTWIINGIKQITKMIIQRITQNIW